MSFVILNNELRKQQRDLRHWRDEVGKLQGRIARANDILRELKEHRKRKGATRMRPVSWSLHNLTDDIIFIVDDDKPDCMSVTNAAEAVVKDIYGTYGNRRIVYRDTMGQWDELLHVNGSFIDYAPYHGDPMGLL